MIINYIIAYTVMIAEGLHGQLLSGLIHDW